MWTARANLPFGARPNRDSNVIAFLPTGYTADQHKRAVSEYLGRGYTHMVGGPVTGNDCYHGKYPCERGLPDQERWDRYLDWVQSIWEAGLIPIYFAKPDHWEKPEHAEEWNTLDKLYRQPRAQRLLRVVVYCGWEPDGDRTLWRNDTYVSCLSRGARVFPDALRYLHASCDVEAPRGTTDAGLSDDDAWRRVSPYIHGYLMQSCLYINNEAAAPTEKLLNDWRAAVARMKARVARGTAAHTQTAWNDGRGLQVVAAEYASYRAFWSDWPERYARQLGDAAMCAGADGYLDGGTVSVPMTAAERAATCR